MAEIATEAFHSEKSILMVAGPAGAGGAMIVLIQFLDNCGETQENGDRRGLGCSNSMKHFTKLWFPKDPHHIKRYEMATPLDRLSVFVKRKKRKKK